MKALILTCLVAFALVGCEETTQTISINNHQTGQFITVSDTCSTSNRCNDDVLSNSRTVYVGNGTTYLCDLNGFLYRIVKNGSTSTSFKEENTRCSYSVITKDD